ncbi:MAG: phenylacetate-CoA oxygenase/reductase subunit PaaK [Acidimicrobiia bacterium]|nr:phenylacetate-CoA oxygenase/reductase subunit PaaK [Acidimicrobiia bacterium]
MTVATQTEMTGVVFYPLAVSEVERLTDDAVAVTFDVPEELAEEFSYIAGQHIMLRTEVDGRDVRRSYSICSNAFDGTLRVGVKHLAGGAFSTYATTELAPGDVLDVAAPVGDFTIDPDPDTRVHRGAIVAGSGITPVLSLLDTTLESEPDSSWTLIYGNRAADSIMFLEEVAGLKNRYPDRLHLIHVLSRETPEVPLFAGRIDAHKLQKLFEKLVPVADISVWYLCGPYGLVETSREVLGEWGVAPEHIHDELFFAGPQPEMPDDGEDHEYEGAVALVVTLDGRATTTRMDPDMSVLDAALRVRQELPFSCKGGMCASCRGRLTEGTVTMDKNHALTPDELEAGYVLTCQSHPTSDEVAVSYDV